MTGSGAFPSNPFITGGERRRGAAREFVLELLYPSFEGVNCDA